MVAMTGVWRDERARERHRAATALAGLTVNLCVAMVIAQGRSIPMATEMRQ